MNAGDLGSDTYGRCCVGLNAIWQRKMKGSAGSFVVSGACAGTGLPGLARNVP